MDYSIIYRTSEVKSLIKDLLKKKSLAVDSETGNVEDGYSVPAQINKFDNRMMWLQICDGKEVYLIDRKKTGDENIKLFAPVFSSPDVKKIIHNSAFDCTWWKTEFGIHTRNIVDTMNNEKLVLGVAWGDSVSDGSFKKLKKAEKEILKPLWSPMLKYCFTRRGWEDKLGFEEFKWNEPVTDHQINYMVSDVNKLHDLMYDQFKTLEMLGCMNTAELESHVAEIFYLMSYRGFGIDVKGWNKYADEFALKYKEYMAYLKRVQDINWQAPAQACKYFGVRVIAELEMLELKGTKGKTLDVWKAARKIYSNVTKVGRNWTNDYVINGRVNCQFNQILNTGRCSSSNPNLQNLPSLVKSNHRLFFKPKKGNIFGIADFKGQELAIMAVGSGEKSWLDCLRRGEDLHIMTGMMVFGARWNAASAEERKELRRIIKNVNFGIAYGMGAERLSNEAEISLEFAEEVLSIYRKTFKKLMSWLWRNTQYTVQHGVSYSFEPFLRRRDVAALESEEWRWKTIGKNNPVQSTAADMTKLAMLYMHQELEERKQQTVVLEGKKKVKLVFDDPNDLLGIIHQMHDELICEWIDDDKQWLHDTMKECMARANETILGERLGVPDVILAYEWNKP